MLALYSMLSGTYYAQNYASIIGGSLIVSVRSKAIKNDIFVLKDVFVNLFFTGLWAVLIV